MSEDEPHFWVQVLHILSRKECKISSSNEGQLQNIR